MKELREITGMRGAAAWLVVGFHAVVIYAFAGAGYPGGVTALLLNFGWIGVDFFFVLSGFLLALPLLKNPDRVLTTRFWPVYLMKRWMRIAPAYYVSILLVLLLFGQVSYLWTDPADVLSHLTYLHSFSPQGFVSINGVYWTLALEAQFYVLLPLLAFLFARRSWPWTLAVLMAMSLTWRSLFFDPTSMARASWLSAQLPAFMGHFGLGLAAARLYVSDWRPSPAGSRWMSAGVAGFSLVPLLALVPRGQTGGLWVASFATNLVVRDMVAVACALLILLVVQPASRARRVFASGPVERLGAMSYSVYLVHVPLYVFLMRFTVASGHGFLVFLAWGLVSTLLVSTTFYGLVERPFLKIKADLGASRRARVPALPGQPSTPTWPQPLAQVSMSHVTGLASSPVGAAAEASPA